MRAPKSPFERHMSKRIFLFASLTCSSISGAKVLKKRVCDLLYLISVKSVVFFFLRWRGGWHFYAILVPIFYAAIFFISNIFATKHEHYKLQITFIQYSTTYNTTTTNKY